jgi:hypothetical protein
MGKVTFNFVSTRPNGDYCLYLVEEPPVLGARYDPKLWTAGLGRQLRKQV